MKPKLKRVELYLLLDLVKKLIKYLTIRFKLEVIKHFRHKYS